MRLADGSQVEGNPLGVNPSAVSEDGRRVAWDLGEPHSAADKHMKVCLCVIWWMGVLSG